MSTSTTTPWVLGHGSWCSSLAERCPLPGCVVVDALAAESAPFFHLVNAANARAFGGMAMPAWVQLDCVCLPSAMIGLGRARADVDAALFAGLRAGVLATFGARAADAVDAWQGLVPLAEYGCVATPEPGRVVGFSLFSLVPGLGLRTKAMALAMHQARVQVGIAQVDNAALRTHVALGPLDVVAAQVPVHSKPEATIVYALRVPAPAVLAGIARGDALPPREPGSVRIGIGRDTTMQLTALLRDHGPHAIVDVHDGALLLAPCRAEASAAPSPRAR